MRFLVLSESVSLAHCVRPLQVARALAALGHDVCLAGDSAEFPFPSDARMRFRHLPCIGRKKFLDRISASQIPYRTAELEQYSAIDREILSAENPDAVIHDFRLTLQFLPALTAGKLVTIANIYWRGAGERFASMPLPQCGMAGRISALLPRPLGSFTGALADYLAGAPFDALSKKAGIEPKRRFSRYFLAGDYRLFADPPELYRAYQRSSNEIFTGHIDWIPSPEQVEPLPDAEFDLFISLGSSGPSDRIPELAEWAIEMNLRVLICTGYAPTEILAGLEIPKEWCIRHFVDGNDAARRSAVTVCNGGSPSVYQALAAGSTVLGVPSNFDQAFCMRALANNPRVKSVPLALLNRDRFCRLVQELLPVRRDLSEMPHKADARSTGGRRQNLTQALISLTEELQRGNSAAEESYAARA